MRIEGVEVECYESVRRQRSDPLVGPDAYRDSGSHGAVAGSHCLDMVHTRHAGLIEGEHRRARSA